MIVNLVVALIVETEPFFLDFMKDKLLDVLYSI